MTKAKRETKHVCQMINYDCTTSRTTVLILNSRLFVCDGGKSNIISTVRNVEGLLLQTFLFRLGKLTKLGNSNFVVQNLQSMSKANLENE